MVNIDTDRTEAIKIANRELHNTLSNDSIGLTALLFFLLKNKLESPAIDDIILQANIWIDEKVNKNVFSRFLDRELVQLYLAIMH